MPAYRSRLPVLAVVGILFFLCIQQGAVASCCDMARLIHNGAYGVADPSGQVLEGCRVDASYIPASVIKLITAMATLDILGPEYRFSTEIYLDKDHALYIRGSGDPLLLSENVREIVCQLKRRGLRRVERIFIDDSLYELESSPPGSSLSDNPYDAPVTAAAVNFNSLPITVNRMGEVGSGESQTPYIACMQDAGKGLTRGKYRINICSGGCLQEQAAGRYTAELFQAFLRKEHVEVGNECGLKKVPVGAPLVYKYRSRKTAEDGVRLMLHYSSNFLANQLFLTCGAVTCGYPATWKKGREAVTGFLVRKLGREKASTITMVEGAGLSRENRVTVRTMLDILHLFAPHAALMRKKEGTLTKSGTMEGIYNYAGYLPNGFPYVILLNQQKNKRSQILDLLKSR
ncbi:MAG: hypothetical protein CSA32_02460 [Desulfobulbus propionicus]|nr:MAG: hypothetical protein CSA32_02460 [Desulfobulbus propionicus]